MATQLLAKGAGMPKGPFNMVAEKIVEYLRKQCAFNDTNGISFTSYTIAPIIGHTPAGCQRNIRSLIDSGILIVKTGRYGKGFSHNPSSFVLAEGYEQGNSWKDKFSVAKTPADGNGDTASPKTRTSRRLKYLYLGNGGLQVAKAHAETLIRLEQASVENNQLREQLLAALQEKKSFSEQVTALRQELGEIEQRERQAQMAMIDADRQLTAATGRIAAEDKRKFLLDRQIGALAGQR